jgi:Fe-S oxidoreductase
MSFIHEIELKDIPENVVNEAKGCFRDWLAAESIILARERAVKADVIPNEVRRLRRNILEADSLSGLDKEKAASWASQLGFPESGKTLFFSSCEYSATEDGRRVLALTADLIKKARVSISYLYRNEPCCGGPLYFYGFREDFIQKVVEVVKLLKERGVEEIITPSPLCAYTLKELYPKYAGDFNIEVKTVLEVILEKINSKDIRMKNIGNQKVVFHDPPFLARYLGMVDEPREVLGSIPGVSVEKPKYYWGDDTMGDGNLGVSEEINSKIAQARLKELAACGAATVITASAFDLSKMKKAAQDLGKQAIEIVDLIEFVSQALEV